MGEDLDGARDAVRRRTVVDGQVHAWLGGPGIPPHWSVMHCNELTAETLLDEMDAAGVDRTVLVPPTFTPDNAYCVEAARRAPDRFAVMGRVSLNSPRDLAGWREQPGMLGVRVSFSQSEARDDFLAGQVDWLWREAATHDLPVMVFAPGLLAELGGVARRYETLRIVVDHCGLGVGVRDEAIDPVLDRLIELAPLENVAVKASCLPSNVTETYPFPSLPSRIRRVTEAFGSRRVFWGSDLTRLPCSYAECLALFTDHLPFLDADDLDWVLGKGICAWLGWPVPEHTA